MPSGRRDFALILKWPADLSEFPPTITRLCAFTKRIADDGKLDNASATEGFANLVRFTKLTSLLELLEKSENQSLWRAGRVSHSFGERGRKPARKRPVDDTPASYNLPFT
jgi:hypothetical protein